MLINIRLNGCNTIYWLPLTDRHWNYFQLFSMTKMAAVTFLYRCLHVHELSMPSGKILEVELLSQSICTFLKYDTAKLPSKVFVPINTPRGHFWSTKILKRKLQCRQCQKGNVNSWGRLGWDGKLEGAVSHWKKQLLLKPSPLKTPSRNTMLSVVRLFDFSKAKLWTSA